MVMAVNLNGRQKMTSEELADIILESDLCLYEVALAIEIAFKCYMSREFSYMSMEDLEEHSKRIAFYMSALNYARI